MAETKHINMIEPVENKEGDSRMAETKTPKTFEEIFNALYYLDTSTHIEKKAGLSYLSWPWAVAEATKVCPDWSYEIKKFGEAQLPYTLDPKTGYLVYTSVTMAGVTKEMWLPVMDGANKAMRDEPYQYEVYDKYKKQTVTKTVEAATMFDINKTIMRCLVKNLAMFGIGLHIYAGEDLPEEVPVDPVVQNELKATIIQIDGLAKSLMNEKKVTKPELIATITKYHGSANYNSIDNLDVAKKILVELTNKNEAKTEPEKKTEKAKEKA